MRKSVAAGLLFTLLVSGSVFAEVDGNGWRKLDSVNQAAYMQGVLDVGTTLDQFSGEAAKAKGQSVRVLECASYPCFLCFGGMRPGFKNTC